MDENKVRTIEFGLEKEISFQFGSFLVNTVMQINKFEQIATTAKEIVKIEKYGITGRYPFKTCAACYDHVYEMLITVTPIDCEFMVFFPNQTMKEPMMKGVKLNQMGVLHMIFDPKTAILITIGLGVKTWDVYALKADKRKSWFDNNIKITPRASFAPTYNASMLSPPCYDPLKREIIIPTTEGLVTYDMDGKIKQTPIIFRDNYYTLYIINPFNQKILSSDRDISDDEKAHRRKYRMKAMSYEGICYWRPNGKLINRVPFTNSSLFAAYFINKEFFICLDAALFIHIVDIKTFRFFPMVQLRERPHRIFFTLEPVMRLIIVTNNDVAYYKINIPWRLWKKTSTRPVKIERCPMHEKAARIGVQLADSSITYLTPERAMCVTLCHSTIPALPVKMLTDRGIPGKFIRDQLFVIFDNGFVEIFGTNSNPCEPAMTIDLRATTSIICQMFNTITICYGTKVGEILVYDYKRLEFIRRIVVCQDPILEIYYYPKTQELFVQIFYKLIRINQDGVLTEEIRQDAGTCAIIVSDLFVVGYKDGSLLIKRILDRGMETIFNEEHPTHTGGVTSISAGSTYFITTGHEGTIIVWNLNAEKLVSLHFPINIFSSAVLNGKRDILLGTDGEIMVVDGSQIFDEIDPEDIPFDNYDRRTDELNDLFDLFKKKKEKIVVRSSILNMRGGDSSSSDDGMNIKENSTRAARLKRFKMQMQAQMKAREGNFQDVDGEGKEVDAELIKQHEERKKKEERMKLLNDMKKLTETEGNDRMYLDNYNDDEYEEEDETGAGENAAKQAENDGKAEEKGKADKKDKKEKDKKKKGKKGRKRTKGKSTKSKSGKSGRSSKQVSEDEYYEEEEEDESYEDAESNENTEEAELEEEQDSQENHDGEENENESNENAESKENEEDESNKEGADAEAEAIEQEGEGQGENEGDKEGENIEEENNDEENKDSKEKEAESIVVEEKPVVKAKYTPKPIQPPKTFRIPNRDGGKGVTTSKTHNLNDETKLNGEKKKKKRAPRKKSTKPKEYYIPGLGKVTNKEWNGETSTFGFSTSRRPGSSGSMKGGNLPIMTFYRKPNRPPTPNAEYLYRMHRIPHYFRKDWTVHPDFKIEETKNPPCLLFDKDTIRERCGSKLSTFRKLTCFLDGPIMEEGLNKHFVLTNPQHIDESNDIPTDVATIFQLKEDPPPLVEVPPFELPQKDTTIKNPLALNMILKSPPQTARRLNSVKSPRATTAPKTARAIVRPREGSARMNPRNRNRRQFHLEFVEDGEERRFFFETAVPPQSARAFTPKIINPGNKKQTFRNLVAVFNSVHRK